MLFAGVRGRVSVVPVSRLANSRRAQRHPALRAGRGPRGRDLRMHGAGEGGRSLGLRRARHELHAALRALARPGGDDLRMHWTGVDARVDPTRRADLVHLGDEGERLVGRSLDERLDPLCVAPSCLRSCAGFRTALSGRARPARQRPGSQQAGRTSRAFDARARALRALSKRTSTTTRSEGASRTSSTSSSCS